MGQGIDVKGVDQKNQAGALNRRKQFTLTLGPMQARAER